MSDNFYDDILSDKDEMQVDPAKLKSIADLAAKQAALEAEVSAMEDALKAAQENLRKVQMEQLPAAMADAGVSEFKLTDGRKVTVSDFVRCNITDANRKAAYDWLRSNGAEPLIRNELKHTFIKGEDAKARQIIDALKKLGVHAEITETIPWNTLSAWAKEQLDGGKALPDKLLGLFVGKKAKVN